MGSDEDALVDAVRAARDEGCPVAGRSEAEHREVAKRALRRWRSFERRHPRKRDLPAERIEDLAKGLCAPQASRALAGPLMADYRWLARRLAEVLAD